MSVTRIFLEPSGDADFAVAGTNGFWTSPSGTIASDFVHGNHQRSIKFLYSSSQNNQVKPSTGNAITTAGTRISFYLYINALPTATSRIFACTPSAGAPSVILLLTSAGVLRLATGNTPTQIGTDGSTLTTGVWYRISLALTITSTTVNRFEQFVNGASSISITNATLSTSNPINLLIGANTSDATFDIRTSDHYIDNSSTLTDTGDIWVTAKRPVSNGTTNGFTTQIGSGGSGYGTGHSPQVNERPLSVSNGWSMIGAGSAITEEYNIEGQSVGDITTVGGTIIDYLGWVSASSLSSETASIIVNNVTSNISLTSTNTLFTKIAGSTTYPSGSGTDIGIITTAALTTVSLYESGIVVAFIPPAQPSVTDSTAISDTPTIEIISYINSTDSTAVSDIPTIELFSFFTVLDSAAVSDSVTLEIFSYPTVSDSTAVSDSPTLEILDQGIKITDSTAVSDTPTIEIVSYISVSDSSAVTDTSTILIPTLYIIVSDSSSISDSPSIIVGGSGASVTDTTAVSDTVTMFIPIYTLTVTDSIAVTDTGAMNMQVLVSVSDTSAVSESLNLQEFSYVNVSDSTVISDTIQMGGTLYISVLDSSAVSEVVTTRSFSYIAVTDSTAVSDTDITLIPVLIIFVTDTTTVTDSFNDTESSPLVIVSDSTSIAESINIVIRSAYIPITEAYVIQVGWQSSNYVMKLE